MIIIWVIDAIILFSGLWLLIYAHRLVSWWIVQHERISTRIDSLQPVLGYQFYRKIGPVLFRIMGVIAIGFSLVLAFIVLFR